MAATSCVLLNITISALVVVVLVIAEISLLDVGSEAAFENNVTDDKLRTNDALTELAVTGFDASVLDVTSNERVACVVGSKFISCMDVSFFFEIAVCVKCAMELSLEAANASSLAVDICSVVIKEWLLIMLKDHELVSVFSFAFVSVKTVIMIPAVEASINGVEYS